MATKGAIGTKGLATSGNPLVFEPGELAVADNAVIPSRNMVRPRNGQMLQSEYASGSNGYIDGDSGDTASNRAKELYQWGTALFVNYTGSGGYKLASFANWASSPSRALVGSYTPPAPATLRMKFAQLAKSLYWTTDAGLYVLDVVGGTARAAGLRSPIIVTSNIAGLTGLTGNVSATGAWYAKDKNVAYRVTLAKKDANGRIVESAPSGRTNIVNPNDVTVAIGGLVRNANVVTATVSAHKFRVGDKLNLTVTGGDAGNFDTSDNVVTSVTSTTIVWAETAANYTNIADVVITSGTKSVLLYLLIESTNAAAGDFIRVYRTDTVDGDDSEPGDECFLSYERVISAAEVVAGVVQITDTTPQDFLADPLDTNANSGEGAVAGRNDRPPLANDLCSWDGRLWAFETTDRHRLRIRLLGTGSPNGLQAGDLLAINTRVFTADTVALPLYTQYLPSENVQRTVDAWTLPVRDGTAQGVGFASRVEGDGSTGLGEFIVEQVDLASTMADGSGGAIGAIYAATSRTSAFGDPLATTKAVTAVNTARVSSTVTVRCTGHGFTAGQVIMLARTTSTSTDANFPLGLKTVATVVDANNFTYTESGSAATLSGTYYAYATTYKSDNNPQPARFSRPGIPEAWPLSNTLGGLPDNAVVLRGVPSGSGYSLLLFLKDSSIYRVSGAYPYTVRRLDDTATLLAADSLVPHAGKLHAFTTQGLCAITEAGVGIVGEDVEETLRAMWADVQTGSLDPSTIFGVSYESERQYQLWVPISSAYAGRGYVFRSLSGEFTRYVADRRCGLVFRGADRLVMGDGSTNQLRVERKHYGSNAWRSFADEKFGATTLFTGPGGTGSSWTLILSDAPAGLEAGDVAFCAGTYAIVTAVDGVQIQVSGTAPAAWDIEDAIVFFKRISTTFTFATDTQGAPGIEKRWREVQLHIGQHVYRSLTVSFTNERGATGTVTSTDSSFVVTTVRDGVSTVRIAVPQAVQMGATLNVTLALAEAFSFFELLGYSATSESVSERTGR